MKNSPSKRKILPKITNDNQAENLLNTDLSEYINSTNFHPVSFELLPKNKQVNFRIPENLLVEIKKKAKKLGISYQKYMRLVLESSVFNTKILTK
jgi:predicted DNA binding CopG/RHH family protein